jgi:hypothetical protein
MKKKYKEFKYIPTSDFEKLIKEWVKCERARKMMRRHFIDNVSFERLAEECDISTQRAKGIVYEHADFLLQIVRERYDYLPKP